MAIENRQQRASVAEDLFQNIYQYEFHQAIKILQILNPELEKIGQGLIAHKEIATIKTNVTFSPPPSDIYSLEKSSTPTESVLISINFMGIAGHGGPLPDAYSEILIDRKRSQDYAFADFLDIFSHRIVSISHRIRVKYNFTLEMAKPHKTQAAHILYAIGGITDPEKNEKSLIPPRSYLQYMGHLWQQPKSITGLKIMLRDYFKLNVDIEEFIGQWLYLDESQTTTIGSQGNMNVLGDTASLGDKAWNCTDKIRVCIKSLTLKSYMEFFPGGVLNKKLSLFTHHYLGDQCQFDIAIELNPQDVPFMKLDGTAYLGWTSWLKVEKKTPEIGWVIMQPDVWQSVN